jgi:hypothetical protein
LRSVAAAKKSQTRTLRKQRALELGRPPQEHLLVETLRRLWVGPALLHHHHVKVLMHINPKLDVGFAATKLAAGCLGEDNSV